MAPRPVLLCALALCAAGCGAEKSAAPAPGGEAAIDLRISVDRDGSSGPGAAREHRVRCGEGDDRAACRAAKQLGPADFEPVDPRKACTELFGGPQTAIVRGRLGQDEVASRFSRTNGCEIARWERVSALLERAG